MNGWAGFWIGMGICEVGYLWYTIERKKLEKKGVKFKWTEE